MILFPRVIPRYPRHKYGKIQLQEAVDRIRRKKVEKIIVTTDKQLIPAQKNYESVGFKRVRERENKYNPDYAGNLIDYEMIL